MMKYIFTVLVAAVAILYIYNNSLRNSNRHLSTSVEELTTRLEKSYEENAEIRRQYQELQEASQLDTVFNWSVDISNSPVVKQLRTD